MDRTFWRYMDVDPPEAGESSSLSTQWEECNVAIAQYMDVPYTTWGDYCGGTVERSNYLALLEDYPDTFVDISGGYGGHSLRIPVAGITEDLEEIFAGLEDYPLYNEEHHSMLENDIAWEMWDCFLKWDVQHEWEDSEDFTDKEWDYIRERYYHYTMQQDYGPECEDATSAYFPFHGKVLELVQKEITTLGFENDPRRPNPNDPTLPGIVA